MKLLVVDGNSILNRAFYGIKLLSTKAGEFTNGIYGFLTMLKKVEDETEPQAVAIAFDMRAPTFRHREYAGYKANRKGMPEELAQQLPVLKGLLKALGYKIVTCEGYEADDILGTLSLSCEEKGDECLIATGDRDSLQLVSEKTAVRLAATKFGRPEVTLYDKARVKEEYGVEPCALIDIKAIQGDSSDNIPGVAGIGPKGAGELVKQFGSLEGVYDNINSEKIKDSTRKKLLADRENAFMSYRLGTIDRAAPIDSEPKSYLKASADIQAASALMVRLELFSLIERFGLDKNAALPAKESGKETGRCALEVKRVNPSAVLAMAEDAGKAFFLSEYGKDGEVLRMAFAVGDEVIPVENPSESFLKAFFINVGIKKFTSGIKLLHRAALKFKVELAGAAFDTEIAAYILEPSSKSYDIQELAAVYSVQVPACTDPLFESAAALPLLCEKLSGAIRENGQEKLLSEIELPLAEVLAKMEDVGFFVDSDGIKKYGESLTGEIARLENVITGEVGYEFNINSPKQLGEALFGKLGLPHGKKTKSGWSTNADVLEELRDLHPAVDAVLEYRALSKLKSTYCDGLLKVIGPDGRIHSNFNQTETRTGRISSTEPNLQNIPVRTELGREMRKFFSAESGVLVDADYSQIELRVLAHIAHDGKMAEDFRAGRDIHASTAARVFGMPQDMVTPELRRRAKAVNFGIVYGIGAFSLSKDIGVSVKEADRYIKEYLREYSGVADYMEKTVGKAKENGYVSTMFSRRRYLPELKSSNFNLRSFGERVARNMPIQGTAADIIKIAMIRVDGRMAEEKLKARLILQVHDELIVECPKDEEEHVRQLLTEEMENAVELSVPLVAEANSGRTWYDAKG